jgi:hypothetical protein
MKTIQEIPTWVKGQAVTATIFNLRPIHGELFKFTDFYYQLLDENMAVVADGNLSLSGEAYLEWGNDDEYAYNYAAEKLNLVITGDYVAPVIASSNEPIVDTLNEVAKPIADEPNVKDNLTVETDTEI